MKRNFFYLVVGRGLTLLSGLLAGVLLARILRPAGQGDFALFAISGAMVGELSFAGLYSSLIYHIGKDKARWREFASGWLSLLLLLTVIFNLAAPWLGLHLRFIPGRPWLFWLMLDLGLVLAFVNYCQATLAGREDFLPFTRYSAVFASLQIPALLLGMFLLPADRVTGATLGYTGANLLAAATLGWGLFRGGFAFRWSLRPLVPLLRVGGNAFLVRILWFLLYRSDTYLVNYFRGPYELGLYARAAGLVELLLIFPNVIGFALFPRVAASEKRAGEEATLKTSRCLLPFVAGAAVVLALWGRQLLVLLYGHDFGRGYPALLALVPGLVGIAYGSVTASYLSGLGFPRRYVLMHLAAFLLNVGLNLWAIPRWGILGAGLSSSVAYDLLAVLLMRELLARSGRPLRAALIPSFREFCSYFRLPARQGNV